MKPTYKKPFNKFPVRPTLPYEPETGVYRLKREEFLELMKHPRFLVFLKQFLQESRKYNIPPESYIVLLKTHVIKSSLSTWDELYEFLDAMEWLYEPADNNQKN